MPNNLVVRIEADAPALREGLARIEKELDLPGEFPADVLAEAERAAASAQPSGDDRTDIPLLTIDPEGSMDLDQAMHLARDGERYAVHYAIADVAAFVTPGGAVDAEAHRRGETLYGADSRIPLHPPALSEDAASLLPDQVRPAILWTITLDDAGEIAETAVARASVRSTARWTYTDAQRAIDDGDAEETLLLLKEIGEKRLALEAERGGVSLPLPEQEIQVDDDGSLRLAFREQLPAEQWNAQISLLTGMAAAALMVDAKVGLLRTLPAPDPRDVDRLRRVAKGLRIDWPADQDHAAFIRSLDPGRPEHQAMIYACTRLLRGSGYQAFDGDLPEHTRHEAIAAEYAHVTAPLRRLGDRYALEICVALSGGQEVPGWVREALPDLPATLQDSARRANAYERAVVDLIEAAVLEHRVGTEYAGVITRLDDEHDDHGVVVVGDLGVEAPVHGAGSLPLGEEVRVRLETADPTGPTVEFGLV